MSHLPLFKFYLMRDSTTYYRVVGGSVSTTTTPTPLTFSPDGWDETEINWVRSPKYWGLFRSLTNKYQFVEDGAKILRYLYYTQGVEGKCILKITKRRNSDWVFEDFYSGEVDFSNTTDKDNFFGVNIIDGDLQSKLKANENVSYELPVGTGDRSLLVDGVKLYETFKHIPQGYTDDFHKWFQVPLSFVSRESDYPICSEDNQDWWENFEIDGFTSVGSTWSDSMWYSPCKLNFFPQAATVAKVYGKLEVALRAITPFGGTKLRMALMVVGNDKVVKYVQSVYESATFSGSGLTTYYPEFTATPFTVNAGDRLYLVASLSTPPPAGYLQVEFTGIDEETAANPLYYVQTDVEFIIEPTLIRAKFYYDAFDQLMKLLMGTSASVSTSGLLRQTSATYDNVPAMTMITCGDAIRKLTDVKIKTSLSEMFKDINGRWMGALGINSDNKFIIEHLSYFLDKSTIIYDLGDIADMEITPATEYLFVSHKVGMETKTYDQINGKDEFNQTLEYKTPLVRTQAVLDQVSKYRWDCYGVETYRANLTKKTSTDSESDNDTFVFSTEYSSTGYKLRRPPSGSTIRGVKSPDTIYNVDLSPKRNMLRNGAILSACCHLRPGTDYVTYQTSEKNPYFSARFGAGGLFVYEVRNELISGLDSPLFYPIIFQFKTIVPTNMMALMASMPRGCFRFKYRGTTFKGFPMEVGYKPSNNDSYTFKLLSTPDNDLTKLY